MTALNVRQHQVINKNMVPTEHNSFFHAIGDVLTNHWDPLGILDSHWPHDKYDRYIPAIYTRALNSKSKKDLIQYLSLLAADELGIASNLINDKRAADLILAVRDYFLRNTS